MVKYFTKLMGRFDHVH